MANTKQTTFTREDINAIFTGKVAGLLMKGYILNPATMSGSESEIAKVDLRKGDELLRVWMEMGHNDWPSLVDTLHIRIGRCNDERCLEHGFGGLGAGYTVWNDKLEVLEDTMLAVIDSRKGIFTTLGEGMTVSDKRMARLGVRHELWGGHGRELTNDKAKAIALKYIQRQPRMKSCKLSDIERVERREYIEYGKPQPLFEGYCITAKGRSFYLKPAAR